VVDDDCLLHPQALGRGLPRLDTSSYSTRFWLLNHFTVPLGIDVRSPVSGRRIVMPRIQKDKTFLTIGVCSQRARVMARCNDRYFPICLLHGRAQVMWVTGRTHAQTLRLLSRSHRANASLGRGVSPSWMGFKEPPGGRPTTQDIRNI
jgi:hypothetical protein